MACADGSIVRQRHVEDLSVTTNAHEAVEELSDAMFSVPRLHKENWAKPP